MSETTANILDDAADYIEKHGWAQRTYFDSQTGAACVMGAIMRSTVDSDLVDSARAAIIEQVKHTGPLPLGVASWNDKSGRTKQQVLDTLRAVAKLERMA